MGTYERSATIQADMDTVFGYFADVHNLPDYLDEMKTAEPAQGDAVDVTAVVDIPGQGKSEVHNEAWFRVDQDAHRIEWGSEGDNDYHGSLDASPGSDGATDITITVHTESVETDQINQSLDSALENIERAVGR